MQLQRRHARHLDGRGPDLAGRRRRRRLRHRRRRLDHGHPVRRRHGTRHASASVACSAPTPGIGISLGDDCVVEAGLYVTAGTKVTLPDGTVVKAAELSGVEQPAVPAATRVTGAVEARPRTGHRHRAQRRAARQRLSRRAPHRHAPRRRAARSPAPLARAPRASSPSCSSRSASSAGRLVGVAGRLVHHLGGRRCQPTARAAARLRPRAGRQRRAHRRRRVKRGLPAARRDDRHHDGDPGVEAAQPELRRPRLPRPVPAAAEPGLGHGGADPRPRARDATRSTTPW